MATKPAALSEHDRRYTELDYDFRPQTCPICGHPPTQFLGKRGGKFHRQQLGVACEIWRCRSCDLIFPNPMPFPRHGLNQHYDVPLEEYFYGQSQASQEAAARSVLINAERFLGRKGKVLDVGSGDGSIPLVGNSIGWQVTAVEPSASFANFMRKRGIEVIQSSIEECRIAPESFDVVILSAVLEHLYFPAETLEIMSKALRPGGYFFADVPNERGLYHRVGNLYYGLRHPGANVNLAPTFTPYHVFGYSRRSLQKLLAKYGLTPQSWRIFGGKTRLPLRAGLGGSLETEAVRAFHWLGGILQMGSYVEVWATKRQ